MPYNMNSITRQKYNYVHIIKKNSCVTYVHIYLFDKQKTNYLQPSLIINL